MASYLASIQAFGCIASTCQNRLVGFRQRTPLVEVDHHMHHAAALPPAGVVVDLGDTDEAELLVVVRTDELGRVDGAVLQCGIDVGVREVQRLDADARQNRPAERTDAEPQPLEILERGDLLLEPGAHLCAGGPGRDAVRVELLQRSVDDVAATPEHPPRQLMTGIEAERQAAAEPEHRILLAVEEEWCVRAFDRTAGDCIERLAARGQLARRERLNLEPTVGQLGHVSADDLRTAVERIKGFGVAGGQAPLELGRGVGNRRSCESRCCKHARSPRSQEVSALHGYSSPPI